MPTVKFEDMQFYVSIIISLMIKRMLENRPIIIDGFGVFDIRKRRYRIYDMISKRNEDFMRECSEIKFRMHYDFLKMAEIIGWDFIKKAKAKNNGIDEKKRNIKI